MTNAGPATGLANCICGKECWPGDESYEEVHDETNYVQVCTCGQRCVIHDPAPAATITVSSERPALSEGREASVATMTNAVDTGGRETFSEAQLIPLLNAYLTHRAAREKADRAMKIAAAPIRQWLEKHGGQLFDGETRIAAALQDKRGAPECDLMTMAETESHLVLWLAVHGLLKLDHKAWLALDGKARETMRIKDFISPGPGSQSLRIERAE